MFAQVCVPGTEGVAGYPTEFITHDGPDWESSARSRAYVRRDGKFSFTPTGGFAAGFTTARTTKGVPLTYVKWGVAVIDGDVKLVVDGALTDTLGDPTDFLSYEVIVHNGRASVWGVKTSGREELTSRYKLVGEVIFAAGIVRSGESAIDDPVLLQLRTVSQEVTGTLALVGPLVGRAVFERAALGVLPLSGRVSSRVNGEWYETASGRLGLQGYARPHVVSTFSESGGVSATGVLPLRGELGEVVFGGTVVHLPKQEVFAGNLRGSAEVTVSPLEVEGGDTGYTVPDRTVSYRRNGPLVQGGGLTGEVGGALDLRVPAMYTVGSNYPLSYGTLTLAKPTINAGGAYFGLGQAVVFDFVAIGDYYNPMAAILVGFTSELGVAGDVSITIALDATMESALRLTDTMTLAQILEAVISDSLTLSDGQAPEAAAYKQYVYNLLSGAASRFDGFDFDGFAHFNGETYAYNTTGVHRVVNTPTDPIAAMVDLGVSTFGVSSMKHVETAYIGLATDGEVFLKLVADGRDKTYRVVQRFPTMRAHTGRGVVGREWGVQLQLLDATAADLDDIEFVLATSGRRWTR